MKKIVSIKLANGDYYVIGKDWMMIEKFYNNGKLWFTVVGIGDYVDEINGDYVTTIRYEK